MNFSLCHSCVATFQRRKENKAEQKRKYLLSIYQAMEQDLLNDKVNFSLVFNSIVNEAIAMTSSTYGVLAYFNPDGEHYVLALSNSAWNYSSFNFYREYRDLETFHYFVRDVGSARYYNNKSSSTVVPEGHPPIDSYAIAPIQFSFKSKLYLMVCNKKKKYNNEDIRTIDSLLRAIAATVRHYLFLVE